jgi:mannose-6-phosphate isomerase-like protein (cupin superfamily)
MSYSENVAELARTNTDFRRVLFTGEHTQLVVMSVPPGGEIGEEVHEDIDQVLSFVSGTGEAVLDDLTTAVAPGSVVVVPAGTKHNFRTTGEEAMQLFTVYGPPDHPPGTVHRTKAEADADAADVPPGH